MNFKLTFGLAIALVVLALAIFLMPEKKAAAPDNSGTTALFTAEKPVTNVKYSHDGQEQLAFEKSGDNWNLSYPVKGKAAQYQVGAATESLNSLRYRQSFEPEEGTGTHSADYTGTAKPRSVIEFSEEGGAKHTINFGKTAVGGIYATVDSSKTIYLLDGNPLDPLNKAPSTFRDTAIKTIDGTITGLTIKHGDQAVKLTKQGDAWEIVAPIHGRANASVVEDIASQLRYVNAAAFSDMTKDMPATGLTPPVVSVTAEYSAESPATTKPATTQKVDTATLDVGYYTDLTSKKNVYATMSDTSDVFTLGADALKKLDKSLADLRDPVIVPVALTGATGVKIATGDQKMGVELKKGPDGWQMIEAGSAKFAGDSSAIAELTTAMKNLRAIKYVDNVGDLKSIGLDPPAETIEVTIPAEGTQKGGTGTLLLGKAEKADNVTPIMWKGEGGGETVYLVQTGDAEKVKAFHALTLRSKEIERLTANDIQTVTIAVREKNQRTVLQRDGAAWNALENGKSTKADPVKISALLGELAPVTVASYVDENASVIGTPDVQLTIAALDFTSTPTTNPTTAPAAAGPKMAKTVTRTLKMYKVGSLWRGIWEGSRESAWTFVPSNALVTLATAGGFAAAPTSQPATAPATQP